MKDNVALTNAPVTVAARRAPKPEIEETPGFLVAWNAPATTSWRTWQAPACEVSREEAAYLNSSYCHPAIDA